MQQPTSDYLLRFPMLIACYPGGGFAWAKHSPAQRDPNHLLQHPRFSVCFFLSPSLPPRSLLSPGLFYTPRSFA